MKIRKFQIDRDLEHLETYLRDQYIINKNTTSWLPERLHDLIYRISAHEADQGIERSMDYIFLCEENEKIVACILPDGENIYFSIKKVLKIFLALSSLTVKIAAFHFFVRQRMVR